MSQEKLSTLLEILRFSDKYLNEKGIKDSRLNSELLMADVLNCKRFDLYMQFDKPLNVEEKEKFKSYLLRRADGEPLQYITGHTEFYGYKIFVNKNVLIPRPDTEVLVEKFLDYSKSIEEELKMLEIGTGSGGIAVAVCNELKKDNKKYIFKSIDINKDALIVAEKNLKYNNCENYNLYNEDFFSDNFEYNTYGCNIIISNPPYISKSTYLTLDKEVIDYEPLSALTDGNDGLDFYRKFFKLYKKYNLKHFLEISYDAKEKLIEIMNQENISNFEFYKDYSNNNRILIVK